jgi:hypothetical protein
MRGIKMNSWIKATLVISLLGLGACASKKKSNPDAQLSKATAKTSEPHYSEPTPPPAEEKPARVKKKKPTKKRTAKTSG